MRIGGWRCRLCKKKSKSAMAALASAKVQLEASAVDETTSPVLQDLVAASTTTVNFLADAYILSLLVRVTDSFGDTKRRLRVARKRNDQFRQ